MNDMQRDCEHGQLARSCEICELKRELAAANAVVEKTAEFIEGLIDVGEIVNMVHEYIDSQYKKDAGRYRFLRDNPHFQIEYTGELTLDEYIDAAIAAKEKL